MRGQQLQHRPPGQSLAAAPHVLPHPEGPTCPPSGSRVCWAPPSQVGRVPFPRLSLQVEGVLDLRACWTCGFWPAVPQRHTGALLPPGPSVCPHNAPDNRKERFPRQVAASVLEAQGSGRQAHSSRDQQGLCLCSPPARPSSHQPFIPKATSQSSTAAAAPTMTSHSRTQKALPQGFSRRSRNTTQCTHTSLRCLS